jgi:hypothetical protein
MSWIDIVNSLFYIAGAVYGWYSVVEILATKRVEGYVWHTQGLYFAWGVWNLFMYSHLHYWVTLTADAIGSVASLTYFILAYIYLRKEKRA